MIGGGNFSPPAPPAAGGGGADAWLARHARPMRDIDLGLGRVRAVGRRLGLSPAFPIITVGGTNGKGSVAAILEAVLSAAGRRIGCYTSPHLLRFGERVRVSRAAAGEEEILAALKEVAAAAAGRGGDIPLTYFELTTLAALRVFIARKVEAAVLEVGLGGRLDAVNVFAPTVAVATNIALDHAEFLGDTRDAIGAEKAGIFRRGRPAVVGDLQPPAGLLAAAKKKRAKLRLNGRDFAAEKAGRVWHFRGRRDVLNLPLPALRGAHQTQNAATALAAIEELPRDWRCGNGAVREGLHSVELPGRFQVFAGQPATIADVAHNPAAAAALERELFAMGFFPRTRAVFAMQAKKDIQGFVAALQRRIDFWYIAQPADGDLPAEKIAAEVNAVCGGGKTKTFPTIAEAYTAAKNDSEKEDRILITGSFLTVADFLRHKEKRQEKK